MPERPEYESLTVLHPAGLGEEVLSGCKRVRLLLPKIRDRMISYAPYPASPEFAGIAQSQQTTRVCSGGKQVTV